jgi:hypothetical protein
MTVQRKPVPNLIQGVSQQAAEQRRDSQAEAQFNCINSPKDGATPRHGADLTALITGDFTDAFPYELFRGPNERYRVLIKGGALRVFNVLTGAECTVTPIGAAASYLAVGGGALAKDSFVAQTVDDFTFLANKTILPAMAATTSPARPNEGLVFIRAGGYMVKYTLTIHYAGGKHYWSYTTPGNADAENAVFVDTAQIAASLFRAMTNTVAASVPMPGSGGLFGGDTGGAGGVNTGANAKSIIERSGVIPAGFTVEINGNLLRVARVDNAAFDISMTDGVGNQYSSAYKGNARSFGDLPKGGFDGFVLQVRGLKSDNADDYYVRYTSANNADGYWTETVAAGILTSLNPSTMPHYLVNTGLNTFELRVGVWSTRIAGDAESNKEPSFIGKPIQDVYYDHKRLGFLTEGSTVWGKTGNPFTFFRDTVQTVLATDPIDTTLSAPGKIGLFRKAIGVDESLYLWAQGIQLRATSGQDPFRQDTVETLPSTAYEFSEKADFTSVGTSLFFATEPGDFSSIRQLIFQQGKPQGDTDVTAHVSEYIPEDVRDMTASDTLRLILVRSEQTPNALYAYNFLQQKQDLVQSAWNTWTLPLGTILWASIDKATLSLGLQRPDGLALMLLPLRGNAVDNRVAGDTYRTRLDMRVTEEDCTVTYNPLTDTTSIVLPYAVALAEEAEVRVAIRTSGDTAPHLRARGYVFNITDITGATITVQGNAAAYEFYAGFRATAIRDESEFHLRGPDGIVPTERLRVDGFGLKYSKTGYTRIEVRTGFGRAVQSMEAGGLTLGASVEGATIGGVPGLVSGLMRIPVQADNGEARIRLINDSILPSRWQSAFWDFEGITDTPISKVGNAE